MAGYVATSEKAVKPEAANSLSPSSSPVSSPLTFSYPPSTTTVDPPETSALFARTVAPPVTVAATQRLAEESM